ncbi:hypothetical protein LBO01_23920 [Companilactobacillus paralimentarius]|nr:hypothetical protein LBO01_23920 [Companilactobacillus paralimentarius]
MDCCNSLLLVDVESEALLELTLSTVLEVSSEFDPMEFKLAVGSGELVRVEGVEESVELELFFELEGLLELAKSVGLEVLEELVEELSLEVLVIDGLFASALTC